MAICMGIIQIVEEKVRERSSSRVRSVCLELGTLSHAAPEAIRFCFAVAAMRTVAEGGVLQGKRPVEFHRQRVFEALRVDAAERRGDQHHVVAAQRRRLSAILFT